MGVAGVYYRNILYRRNKGDWLVYTQGYVDRYSYADTNDLCHTNIVVHISIRLDHNSVSIDIRSLLFYILPPIVDLSDFKDADSWSSLKDGLDAGKSDDTILLDKYELPQDNCVRLATGIIQGTASIVSDGSFNPDSPIGPTGTSVVVLTHSIDCEKNLYAKDLTR